MSANDREEVRRYRHDCSREEQATQQPTTGFQPPLNKPAQADQGEEKIPKPLSRVWNAWRRKRVSRHVAKGMSEEPAEQVARREAAAYAKLALAFGDAAMLSAEARIYQMTDGTVMFYIHFFKPKDVIAAFSPQSIGIFSEYPNRAPL